jgi:hypothetical protein
MMSGERGLRIALVLAGVLAGAAPAVASSLPPLLVPRLANVVTANPANANRRVALIIGNGAYRGGQQPGEGWPALANPVNDANLVATAFAADGFEVTTLINGTHDDIARGVAHFEAETAGAKAAIIYYAGHGFEFGGRNYVVPVDAPVSVTATDLPNRFIDLDLITSAAGQANGLNLIFLDACRTAGPAVTVSDASAQAAPGRPIDLNLPQPSSSGAQVAIFYSTARGEPAFDHAPPQDANSPFAWNVAEMLKAPHIELSDFFRDVTYEVEQQTRRLDPIQQPYVYASVHDDFYFRDAAQPSGNIGSTAPDSASPHLTISDQDLQTIDEPVLAARVLRQYSPSQVLAMAEGGDPLATYLLGYFYEFGVGVPPDAAKARDWLERAAVSHHPAGELEFGYFVEHTARSADDKALALYLYEQAAAQGDAKAKANLAFALLHDSLGKSDPERAVSLYRQAADAGYPNAMYQLAVLSLDPRWARDPRFGLDIQRQVERLRAVANGGNIDGYRYLCEIADARAQTDVRDCKLAAQGGFASAQAHLAVYYHDGRPSVPKSEYEARHWTRLALSQDPRQDPYLTQVLQDRLRGFRY